MKSIIINKFQSAIILILLVTPFALEASHVVGGNIQYRCLGNDQYEITVDFAVDCGIGDEDALALDSFATVKFFDAQSNMLTDVELNGQVTIPFQDVMQLGDPNIACRVLASPVCVQRQRYVQIVTLPFNPNGYIISYRRCCRNNTLLNVVDPLDTGGTYWIELTPQAQTECNTAARFRNEPEIYVCANEDIIFDASAIDEDGDSLVYRLCVPTEGGSQDNPQSSDIYFPPFQNVTFAQGYSLDNLMSVGTPVAIDSLTGELTLNAGLIGQFLIGVCVEEYRDGVKISETRRDFQYNVRMCTDPPTADFNAEPNPNCDDLTVQFTNGSSSTQGNPLSYEWYFDFPNLIPFSSDEDPSFTFGQPGLYNVALVTFDGICQDTSFQMVGVSVPGDPDVDFELTASGCELGDIDVFLSSLSTSNQSITAYNWAVLSNTGTDFYTGSNPNFTVTGAQTLTVTLEVTTISGCIGSVTMDLPVTGEPGPVLDAQLSAASLFSCDNTAVVLNPNGNTQFGYSWISSDPNVNFNATDISPVVVITQPTTFTVTVTDQQGCTSLGSVNVSPATSPVLNFGPNDLSQCLGGSIALNPTGTPAFTYNWTSNPPGVIPNPTDPNPVVSITTNTSFSVTVTDPASGCFTIGTVNVIIGTGPTLNLDTDLVQCLGDDIPLNPNGADNVLYNWTSNPPGALVDPTAPNPIVSLTSTTSFAVTVSDPVNPDCSTEYALTVTVPELSEISIEPDTVFVVCAGDTTDLSIMTNGDSVVWIGPNGDTLSTDLSIEVPFEEDGIYTVVVFDEFGCSTEQDINVLNGDFEEILISSSTNSQFYCVGDSVTLSFVMNSVDFMAFEWLDENGNVIGNGEEITVLPSDSVTYFLNAITSDGCILTGDYLLIPSTGEVEIEGPTEVCLFDETEYNSMIVDGTPVTYEWLPESIIVGPNDQSTVIVSPQSDITLTLNVTNAQGCVFSDDQAITLLSVGLITIVADPETIAFGQSTQMSVTPNVPGFSYSWSPAEDFDDPFSPTPIVTPSSLGDIEYTVEVTSPDGCVDTRTITIFVEDTPCSIENIHVPNMFTPNGDSHNDEFTVYTNVQDQQRLIVFDRWGEIVFDSEIEGTMTWDGTYEGTELNPDVYGYCVEVSCEDGSKFTKTGNISLIK